MRPRRLGSLLSLGILVVGLPIAASAAPSDAAKVAVPTVTGPVTGGQGFPSLLTTNFDLADVGYERAEYFVEGDATSYRPVGELGSDGKWTVKAKDTAQYKTRIVVYRPIDPEKFSGTVFAEWFNVSAGFDVATDWIPMHTQLIRAGDAYVGVDVQATGIQGGEEALAGATSGGIKAGDPERYGTLHHPGDAYAYDIFSQAGLAAAGHADGVEPLAGLDVQHVIATGESQSAFFLTSYVNAVHPLAHVYDGFLVHSRGGTAPGFEKFTRAVFDAMPKNVHIRTDIDVPVLTLQTETDLTELGFLPARQPDSKNFRLWEMAGASHADQYTGSVGSTDIGDGAAELTLLDPAQANGGILRCSTPINAAASFSVQNAAASHLERWVRGGKPPPKAPRLVMAGKKIVRDEHGIAKGGIRTPIVDVPVAANTGARNVGGRFCDLFGTIAPLDASTLASLYASHDSYVSKFNRSADATVAAGFWLAPDAALWKAAAQQIPVP